MKPTIIVSKCLNNKKCRYDGSGYSNKIIDELMEFVNIIEVCPEVEIGLSIPRDTLRIINNNDRLELIQPKTGNNLTRKMITFSKDFVNKHKGKNIEGVILKSMSPSCGLRDVKVYAQPIKGPVLKRTANGMFTDQIINYFDNIETEGRLSNYIIRDKFYVKLFSLFQLNNIKDKKDVALLKIFHKNNKYLILSYSPYYYKKLDKEINNMNTNTFEQYINIFLKALNVERDHNKNINMLLSLFKMFSKDLSPEERLFFLDILEDYHERKIPFSVPLNLIYGYVIRFNTEQLIDQTIFNPYPKELLNVNDSGKRLLN